MRALARAISAQASSPSLVSIITCRRIALSSELRSSSSRRISSGLLTLGSMRPGGGAGLSRMASRSAMPSRLPIALMRMSTSLLPQGGRPARRSSVPRRADALCGGAIASSRSMQTISGAALMALRNSSGPLPGTKRKLRRGRNGADLFMPRTLTVLRAARNASRSSGRGCRRAASTPECTLDAWLA